MYISGMWVSYNMAVHLFCWDEMALPCPNLSLQTQFLRLLHCRLEHDVVAHWLGWQLITQQGSDLIDLRLTWRELIFTIGEAAWSTSGVRIREEGGREG